jgi:hypothetical protein
VEGRWVKEETRLELWRMGGLEQISGEEIVDGPAMDELTVGC